MKDFVTNIDLPKSWIKTKISETSLRIHYGYTASSTNDKEGVKYLRITDIQGGNVNWNEVPYCEINESELDKFILNRNDIVFARTGGTVGKSFLLDKDFPFKSVFASYLIRIIPSTLVNAKFVTYYFQTNHYWNQIETNKVGLKTNINAQVLGNIKFNLAPLPEQHRIVAKLDELFSELEKGKEQLELVQQKLKVYRQALLKAAFEGQLTAEWRKQQKNLKTPQQLIDEINQYRKEKYKKELKDYEDGNVKIKPNKPEKFELLDDSIIVGLPELPENWCWIQLVNVCEKAKKIKKDEIIPAESFLYIDIGAIDNNLNRIVSCKEYLWKDAPSRAQQIIQFNDILFSTVRTYLKNIAIVKDEKYNNQIGSTGFTIIRAIQKVLNPDYLFKYILSDSFLNPLNELQTGSSYPAVRDSDVFVQYIPLCSIDEQLELVNLLEAKFSVIDNLSVSAENKIRSSESLKQSILQKAFSGQLVRQNPKDEPASVLLERIKKEREQYLEKQAKEKKTVIRKIKISMAEELKTIMQLLHESKNPVAAKTLWQASIHKENIDMFYAELKILIENGEIKETERKGKDSFLTLANSK